MWNFNPCHIHIFFNLCMTDEWERTIEPHYIAWCGFPGGYHHTAWFWSAFSEPWPCLISQLWLHGSMHTTSCNLQAHAISADRWVDKNSVLVIFQKTSVTDKDVWGSHLCLTLWLIANPQVDRPKDDHMLKPSVIVCSRWLNVATVLSEGEKNALEIKPCINHPAVCLNSFFGICVSWHAI